MLLQDDANLDSCIVCTLSTGQASDQEAISVHLLPMSVSLSQTESNKCKTHAM